MGKTESKTKQKKHLPPCLSRRGAFVVWRLPRAPRPALLQGVCRGRWEPLGPGGAAGARGAPRVPLGSCGVLRCPSVPPGASAGRWGKAAGTGSGNGPVSDRLFRARFLASGGAFRKWLWRALWCVPVPSGGLRRVGAVFGPPEGRSESGSGELCGVILWPLRASGGSGPFWAYGEALRKWLLDAWLQTNAPNGVLTSR